MLLKMEHITKQYGAVLANDNVSLSLEQGEILAIVGENGAGKTTIMKILYGLEAPTKGKVFLDDKEVVFRSPFDAISNGIGMVQQHFMLFKPFTVAENIVYGCEPKKAGVFFDRKKAYEQVRELSQKYELDINPLLLVDSCSVGLQQRIEILKVLYQDARIIIFDEPSAVLAPREVNALLETIRKLAQMGKSIIFITHKLREVMDVADRVIIMRKGCKVEEMDISKATIEKMSFKMVGHELMKRDLKEHAIGEHVLLVKDLNYVNEAGKHCIHNVNVQVSGGEIVGIAGVSGNGQTELVQCLTGMSKPQSGQIILNGISVAGSDVRSIRETGCACVPEDRYLHGCAANSSLTHTVLLANQRNPRFSKHGILRNKEITQFATTLLDDFDVTYDSLSQKSNELSGGNLQKAIVAREIAQKTKLLIVSEPTRGVDISATHFIHDKLVEKCEQGDAVLLISAELNEILELADRIYVMYSGRIVGEFSRLEADAEKIGLFMMGGGTKNE